eukprot:jgi/Bigna1/90890/estExt_fgenesh1_pg.C_820034
MTINTTDILASVIILIAGMAGIMFPFLPFARDRPDVQRAGEAHSAGLFVGLALLHMLADAIESWDNYKDSHNIGDDYPYPELMAGLTFVLLLSLDLLQSYLMSTWDDDGKSNSQGIPKWFALTLGVIFAIITPLALLIAAVLDASNNDLAVTCVQGAAAGTFLFLGCESMGSIKGEQGHDHAMDTSSIGKALFCFAFLSAHSVLDGLVVATGGDSDEKTWVLCLAIAFHKLWAAMALGFKLQNVSDKGDQRTKNNMLLVFGSDRKEPNKEEGGEDHRSLLHHHKHPRQRCHIVDYLAFIVGFGVMAAVAVAV